MLRKRLRFSVSTCNNLGIRQMDPLSSLGYQVSSEKTVLRIALSLFSQNIPKKAITSTEGRNISTETKIFAVSI